MLTPATDISLVVMVAIPDVVAGYRERALEQRALRSPPFYPSLPGCLNPRCRQGCAETLTPKPRACSAVDWPAMV